MAHVIIPFAGNRPPCALNIGDRPPPPALDIIALVAKTDPDLISVHIEYKTQQITISK